MCKHCATAHADVLNITYIYRIKKVKSKHNEYMRNKENVPFKFYMLSFFGSLHEYTPD